jgi:hypothetical protein
MQRETEIASMGDWAAKEDEVKFNSIYLRKKIHLIDY